MCSITVHSLSWITDETAAGRMHPGWQPGSLSFNFTAFVLFLFTSLIFPLFGALNSFRHSHLTLERKRGKCWSCRKDHYSIIPLMQCNEATTFSFLSFCGKKFCDKLCPVLDWHRFLWSSQKKWRSRHVSRIGEIRTSAPRQSENKVHASWKYWVLKHRSKCEWCPVSLLIFI